MDASAVPAMPTERTCPLDPPDGLAAFREGPPTRVRLPDGNAHWLVSRHADVRAVLVDPRFSADDSRAGFPRALTFQEGEEGGQFSFLRMDDPEHYRLRRMVTGEFTVRRIERMRPAVTRISDDLLDAMVEKGPPGDLVADYALPLPSLVICDLLGVPYADHARFQRLSAATLSMDLPKEETGAAMVELFDYLDHLVTDKEDHATDDMLGRLVTTRMAKGELTHDELVAMARLLLIAGHETTANMIGLGVMLLLERPAQRAALLADPAVARPMVEELLRYATIVQANMSRIAVEPVELGGVTIGAGEGVVMSLPAANRDPEGFPDPDAFEPGRAEGRHVAFGYGAHQCVGQSLARLEMEIALTRVLERLPELRVAVPESELTFRDESIIYGLRALPVAW